jgi:hypothetical protein
MALGWFVNLAAANTYFTGDSRALSATAWTGLTDAQKQSAVVMAYNRIYYDDNYAVPAYADASATELDILTKINGELAYYLALHIADEDRRKGIQAQGVIGAGVVKETYLANFLHENPLPAVVVAWLKQFKAKKSFYVAEIDRDEDLGVDDNATDF